MDIIILVPKSFSVKLTAFVKSDGLEILESLSNVFINDSACKVYFSCVFAILPVSFLLLLPSSALRVGPVCFQIPIQGRTQVSRPLSPFSFITEESFCLGR